MDKTKYKIEFAEKILTVGEKLKRISYFAFYVGCKLYRTQRNTRKCAGPAPRLPVAELVELEVPPSAVAVPPVAVTTTVTLLVPAAATWAWYVFRLGRGL